MQAAERVDCEDDLDLLDELDPSVKNMKENTGVKHARKRQKSIDTSSSRYM